MEIVSNNECCGCEACASVCQIKCIQMIEDEEGFLMPYIDDERCVECGICKKVCPVLMRK